MRRRGLASSVVALALVGCSDEPCSDASCAVTLVRTELTVGAAFQRLEVTGCDRLLLCSLQDESLRCVRFALTIYAAGSCQVTGELVDGRRVEGNVLVAGEGGDTCCGPKLVVQGGVALVVK